jgi:hypothetical protein
MYREGDTVYVDYARPSPARAELRHFLVGSKSAGNGLRLVARVVPHSLAELNRVMGKVTVTQPWASQAKRAMVDWYADPTADKVIIGVTRITPKLEAAGRQAFGGKAELVVQQRPILDVAVTHVPRGELRVRRVATGESAAKVARTPSRLLDAEPYTGGDRIAYERTKTSVVQCTAGFAWKPRAMITAGHCGPLNRKWLQGYFDASKNELFFSGIIGKAVQVINSNNGGDAARLTGKDYRPYVYRLLRKTQRVVGNAETFKGEVRICADGSFTQENCSGVTAAVNISVKFDENGHKIVVKHLDEVISKNSSRLVQAGDSGGPVYKYVTGGVSARGIIIGGAEAGIEMWMANMKWLRSALHGRPAT